jgi:nucleotide-binding universal stress UspA family protein
MKALELIPQIALKNILFATDFEVSASRALPFALALAGRYGAKLCAAHVVPPAPYALARPESVERILKQVQDYSIYSLNQIVDLAKHRGLLCEALLGEGNVAEVLMDFVRTHAADLIVVGTTSRAGWDKIVLGSVAEEVIRESPCPVLTVGPHEYEAHITLVHVREGSLRDSTRLAIQQDENRLRELIPPEPELLYRPEIVVGTGSVAERILDVAADFSADFIVMGVRGAGAFAQTASRFGSIAHRVVALASCPVVTIGDLQNFKDD